MSSPFRVHAYAPGSVGNVGPGLDILGLALAGAGDEVILEWSTGEGITIVEAGDLTLPTDPARHTAAIAANAVFRRAGVERGVALTMLKGLPLSGGQGGSAASAVAGAVAANHLANAALDHNTLIECALEAEMTISGRHADNIAPSLLGGLTLIRTLDPIEVIAIPVPSQLCVVVVRPAQQVLTREARAVLPRNVTLDTALHQAATVSSMVAAAFLGDVALFGRSIDDQIAEPARAGLLPGFREAKRAALEAGAFGCSISGSGPTAFAIVDSMHSGNVVCSAMIDAYAKCGHRATGRVADVDRLGARVLP